MFLGPNGGQDGAQMRPKIDFYSDWKWWWKVMLFRIGVDQGLSRKVRMEFWAPAEEGFREELASDTEQDLRWRSRRIHPYWHLLAFNFYMASWMVDNGRSALTTPPTFTPQSAGAANSTCFSTCFCWRAIPSPLAHCSNKSRSALTLWLQLDQVCTKFRLSLDQVWTKFRPSLDQV